MKLKQRRVAVFDVYGTLVDPLGITQALELLIGGGVDAFAQTWRRQQLEYSFRRALMRRYKPFSTCIEEALEYSCEKHCITIDDDSKAQMLALYDRLPAYADVKPCLQTLSRSEWALYTFSNGTVQAVSTLLANAGINSFSDRVVSVDNVFSFKPDSAVYWHLINTIGTDPESVWLVSSNPFDIIGAQNVGIKTIWIRRSADSVFDPWKDFAPKTTISSLASLPEILSRC